MNRASRKDIVGMEITNIKGYILYHSIHTYIKLYDEIWYILMY